MSASLAIGGWLAALGVATAGRIVLARRMELVARACHELRGPLTAAQLALRLATDGGPAGTRGGRARGPLAAVDLELGRAGLALADLAAAQRGGRANDRIERFALAPLLADAVAAQRPAAWTRGVRLRLEPPPADVVLRGDRRRLAQACANLLANAIEHGGGDVLLRARASRHTVRVEVLDGGPGLPVPVAELIRRARGGRGERGRGLANVEDAAARFGGRLAAAPSERGARLVLELPIPPRA
ncbi:MAG TPA: HAMP domain-containing sensor histidine kinase [Conexibacter sp.]